jgi:pyridoxamine 5'-phosphate oxidase
MTKITQMDGIPMAEAEGSQAQDPISRFQDWLADAAKTEPNDPTAMALATVDADGRPSVRMVLLKGSDQAGFVFYTNTESRKGLQLTARPVAALCFHWKSLRRQVRVEGRVEPVTAAEADSYFASRPHASRIGAWASDQSRPLDSRATLVARIARTELRFLGQTVTRPPHWSGYRIVPDRIEFWRDGEFRLHDRVVHTRSDDSAPWVSERLYP